MAARAGDVALVTGATGFLAGWVCKTLKERGFRVRGTVRDVKNNDGLKYLAPHVDHFVQANLDSDDGWKEAMDGVAVVFHVACAVNVTTPKAQRAEAVGPARDGTLRVLRASAASASVRRVVLTSSTAAMTGGRCYDMFTTFNEDSNGNAEKASAYDESKIEQERCTRDFVASAECTALRPAGAAPLAMCTMHPAFIVGPAIPDSPRGNPFSNFLQFALSGMMRLSNLAFTMVDVRDVAVAHVLAASDLDDAAFAGTRLLCFDERQQCRLSDVATLVDHTYPGKGAKTRVEPVPLTLVKSFFDGDQWRWNGYCMKLRFDTRASRTKLGGIRKYISWQDAVLDTAQELANKGQL